MRANGIALAFAAIVALGAAAAGAAEEGDVRVIECNKCRMRMRIQDDGKSATVNLCRLRDDGPDEATLAKRVEAMKERARAYIKRGQIRPNGDPRCPLMGWSSWNTFALDISEEIILDTARAMATNGLKEAGYLYVNIDDGFFNGHDESGRLRMHPKRFPAGLKGTVDGIHALGLKAGIYSDAGADTCGAMYGGDKSGIGSGLYGHDAADCKLHFGELGFDFIKVDYCGGGKLGLEERKRYTEIADAIKATGRKDVRLNICRWAFPGTWAADVAESWRTTGDINSSWECIRNIIAENLYLGAYASPGHFNDMDMLETGRLWGEYKENAEVTHFGLWCIMSSPLLVGCDVRTLSDDARKLLTNPYLIGMNQNNALGNQAYVAANDGTNAYVLVKDADERFGRSRYVALYNAGDTEHRFTISSRDLDLDGEIQMFDLVEKGDAGAFRGLIDIWVPPHGAKFYLFDAERRLERTVYEAETAYLSDYQELRNPGEAGTAFPDKEANASGGVLVRYLGNRESNDLVWKDVCIMKSSERTLEFDCITYGERSFFVQIDGGEKREVRVQPPASGVIAKAKLNVRLDKGVHQIRLSNGSAWCPDIDKMTITTAHCAQADFHDWAATSPMGWNSWDCYGAAVNEAEFRANVDVLAERLKPFGYEYAVCDIRWTVQNEGLTGYNQENPVYTLDGWGRYLPAPNRFPSAAKGAGFKPIADYVHSKGLKFGIHIMRGVPKEAVAKKLPVLGANGVTCDQIGNNKVECFWLNDNCTVEKGKPGAQEYYDSIFALYAEWGVDFVKVDDLSAPYHKGEIEMIRKAIDKTGRKIVFSTSPGETPIEENAHLQNHANMWRVVNDVWDSWGHVEHLVPIMCKWLEKDAVQGSWPDCDMIPFGKLGLAGHYWSVDAKAKGRNCNLTADEQRTLMNFFAITRSPLMLGADLPQLDDATFALITDNVILAAQRDGRNPKPLFCTKDACAIASDNVNGGKFLALFNLKNEPAKVSALGIERTLPPHGSELTCIK